MFCFECGGRLRPDAKFCSSCGTAQVEADAPSKQAPRSTNHETCLACQVAVPKSGARICADCSQRDFPPKLCPNCNQSSNRAGLPEGTISAYPRQECEFCSFNYFVPEDLARILHSKKPEPLSSVTLEWLLFASWHWNSRNRQGSIPMIDVDDAGAELLSNGWAIPASSWTEMFWGGDLGYANNLLPIMEKYSAYPQLWSGEEEFFDDGEGGVVVIHCYPNWKTAMDAEQEKALRESLEMTKASTSQDQSLLDFIAKLL